MVEEHLTLEDWDIPLDLSFLAISHLLHWKDQQGFVLFDLIPDGTQTKQLKEILEKHGGGYMDSIEYKDGEPFFTVTRAHSPIYITVFPEAWLGKALKIPAIHDIFSKHPFLNRMLTIQNFFLNIKEKADKDIILGFYKDKLEQYKSSFFDSFADFFNNGYFDNMFLISFSQIAGEKLLIEKFGAEKVFQTLIDNTPMELVSRPVDKLRQSFLTLCSFNK